MIAYASRAAQNYMTNLDDIPNLSESENETQSQRIIANYHMSIMMSRMRDATISATSRKSKS